MSDFGDQLATRLQAVDGESAALAAYAGAVGEQFAQVEGYARGDEGGVVFLGNMLQPIGVGTGDPWWFYYDASARGHLSLASDPEEGTIVVVTGTGADANSWGYSYANQPVGGGDVYRRTVRFKGEPGRSYQLVTNYYQFFNAGGSSVGNVSPAIVATGDWEEHEFVTTTPDWASYAYLYLMTALPTAGGAGSFSVSRFESSRASHAPTSPRAPWARIMDPELADGDSLRWLSQLAGVRLPPGIGEEDARELVELAEGRRRGTLAYMIEVAQRLLTGTRTVFYVERYNGSAYQLRFATRTSETPSEAAVLAALTAVKPAGIVLTYNAVAGITWDEPTHTWTGAGSATWESSSTTVP